MAHARSISTLRVSVFVVAIAAVACSSSGSSDNAPVPKGSFAVSGGSIGSASCFDAVQALLVNGTLAIVCTASGGADPESLNLPGYHGTDTYSFTTSNGDGGQGVGSDQPFFYATLGGLYVGGVGASAVSPATTCTITLTGAASLAKGSEVKGHLHCDNMETAPPEDPSQPYVSPTPGISVDGDFDAFDPIGS